MTWNRWTVLGLLALAALIVAALLTTTGAGGFKRMVTISGVYAVCRPEGYEVVCFLDADSSSGGLACLPLSLVGGECKR